MAGKSYKKLITNTDAGFPQHSTILENNPDGKINIGVQWTYDTHRSGWPVVLEKLSTLHNSKGVLFDGFIEQSFGWHRQNLVNSGEIPYLTPWIGVMHNPPGMPKFFDYMASPQVILDSYFMKQSLPYCQGIFVFSDYSKNWLQSRIDCPVETLVHPTESSKCLFNFKRFQNNKTKKLIQFGFWLRKMYSIKHLETDRFKKIQLVAHEYAKKKSDDEALAIDIRNSEGKLVSGKYEEWDWVSDFEYDYLLSENIVFADLYDSSANNVIVECIVRNTPILVNKIPAVIEYLGEDYPFYFENLNEAHKKLENDNIIKEAHEYLVGLDKKKYCPDFFLDQFQNSKIYKKINIQTNPVVLAEKSPKVDQLQDLNVLSGKPLGNDFIFVVCFRNQQQKLLRCIQSVIAQSKGDRDVGIVLIDDASSDDGLDRVLKYLNDQKSSFVAVKNLERKRYARNLYNAVSLLVTNDEAIILEVDGDDYLENTNVLDRVSIEYEKGAELTFGSFRLSPESVLIPGLEQADNPEQCMNISNPWNLDVCLPWMPLKTYRKTLFNQTPLIYFWERDRNSWLQTAEDLSIYPMMISIAGSKAQFISEKLYVMDTSGTQHEYLKKSQPEYMLNHLYRPPYGQYMGHLAKSIRKKKQKQERNEVRKQKANSTLSTIV